MDALYKFYRQYIFAELVKPSKNVMKIILLLAFILFISDSSSKDVEAGNRTLNIKHRYVESLAKKLFSEKIESNYRIDPNCSPEIKNTNWVCYVSLEKNFYVRTKQGQIKPKKNEWTLVLDFFNDKYSIYEGYVEL